MSFQDTAFIFFIALLLFGPKKLPELARYVGKLMGEFRRASNEFRMQMEDEMRVSEQAEQQKKIAAMEAAAPIAPVLDIPEPEHPHLPAPLYVDTEAPSSDPTMVESEPAADPETETIAEPLPIASSGSLDMMPPATGLPVGRSAGSSSMNGLFDSIPHTSESPAETETATHG